MSGASALKGMGGQEVSGSATTGREGATMHGNPHSNPIMKQYAAVLSRHAPADKPALVPAISKVITFAYLIDGREDG